MSTVLQPLFVTVGNTLRGIFAHKLRTLLTMSGIVIGIAAVTTIVGVGEAGKNNIRQMLLKYKRGTLLISGTSTDGPKGGGMFFQGNPFNQQVPERIYLELRAALRGAAHVVPLSVQSNESIRYRGWQGEADIITTTADFAAIKHLVPREGRFFAPLDSAEAVAVVEVGANGTLEGALTPLVGGYLELGQKRYRVIGTLPRDEVQEGAAMKIYLPLGRATERLVDLVLVRPIGGDSGGLRNRITNLVKLTNSKVAVNIRSIEEEAEQATKAVRLYSNILSIVAIISLFVGLTGVINTMIASVNEKAYELGVLATIGATPVLVFLQFLFESILLCVAAGIVGMMLAVVSIPVVCAHNNYQPVYPIVLFGLSLVMSVAVGIVGGILPAVYAAKMGPYESLRRNT